MIIQTKQKKKEKRKKKKEKGGCKKGENDATTKGTVYIYVYTRNNNKKDRVPLLRGIVSVRHGGGREIV